MLNQKHFLLFLIFVSFNLVSCSSKFENSQKAVVVRVNGSELKLIDFSEQLARRLKDLNSLSAKNPKIVNKTKEALIQEFIMSSLIKIYAEENNIVVTEQELDRKIAEIRSIYPDDLSFRRLLADESISFNDWKQLTQKELLREKVFARLKSEVESVKESELKAYYDTNKEQFKTSDQIYIKQIVVDEQSKAEELKAALKKQSFEEIAKKYSAAPEGKQGGTVGWISRGELPVFDLIFSERVGFVSGVLESDYGFHIIQIVKKRPSGFMPFDEVKEQINNILEAQKEQAIFTKWMDKELRKVKIEKDQTLIESVSVSTEEK